MTFTERLNSQVEVLGLALQGVEGQRRPGDRGTQRAGHGRQHFELGVEVTGSRVMTETEVGHTQNCEEQVDADGKKHR